MTAEELSERDALRKEYIAEWRRGAEHASGMIRVNNWEEIEAVIAGLAQ